MYLRDFQFNTTGNRDRACNIPVTLYMSDWTLDKLILGSMTETKCIESIVSILHIFLS